MRPSSEPLAARIASAIPASADSAESTQRTAPAVIAATRCSQKTSCRLSSAKASPHRVRVQRFGDRSDHLPEIFGSIAIECISASIHRL